MTESGWNLVIGPEGIQFTPFGEAAAVPAWVSDIKALLPDGSVQLPSGIYGDFLGFDPPLAEGSVILRGQEQIATIED